MYSQKRGSGIAAGTAWRSRLMFLNRYLLRFSGAAISPGFEFCFRFIRTVILSRMLTPDNLGASVALATILTSCELVTDVGLHHFVVVWANKSPAQSVAVARQLAMLRAGLMAVAIATLAPWIADLLDASAHLSSIRWLSAVPLIRSFTNWRMLQIQAEYRYRPQAIANVAAQLGAVIAVIPAAVWFHDERAMLASLVTEAILYVSLSHLLLPSQRVTSIDPAVRRAAFAFGLPLMVNGVGLLILSQLDRIIVANLFGLATLALYSLVLNLAIAPTSPLGQIITSLSLPLLGRSQADATQSRQASLIVCLGLLVSGAAYAVGAGLFLDVLVPLIYGPHYVVPPAFRALLAVIAWLRIVRLGPNLILLAHSRTNRLTAGNIVAGGGLFIGFLLAIWSRHVEAVVLGLLLSDLFSVIVLLALTRQHLPIPPLLGHASLLAIPVALGALGPFVVSGAPIGTRGLMLLGAALVIGLDIAIVFRQHLASFVAARHPALKTSTPGRAANLSNCFIEDEAQDD
jgi:O-antigen/teichoic acid export membrane protein